MNEKHYLRDVPLDAAELRREVARPEAGALLEFDGVVRNEHSGRRVVGIEYHAYRPMAAREIEKLEREVEERFPGVRARILHRLGRLEVGESSVLIRVSSPHREEGFRSLRHAIDTLKERVPIWKKELYEDGASWLEGS